MRLTRALPDARRDSTTRTPFCGHCWSQVRIQLANKYGKEWVASAMNEPTALAAGVNSRVFDLFAVRVPPPDIKLAKMAEARAHDSQKRSKLLFSASS